MTAPQDPFSTPPQGQPAQPGGFGAPSGQPAGYGAPPGEPAYGTPAYGQQPPAYGQQPGGFGQPGAFGAPGGFGHGSPKNGFGIAALVLGILSIVTSITVIGGVLFGILAIILGFLGRGRAKKGQATNGGMALTGAILGIVGLVLSVILGFAVGSLLSKADFGSLQECLEQAETQSEIDQCSADFESEFEDSING